ncbi:MAG: hypothetical protein O3B84_00465 [Chloroflexi bacterium]|nr:hypothetical protein [Chloroflexota bacterium]
MFRGKRLFPLFGLSILGLVLIAACSGPAGDPGTRGAAGAAGPQGAQGPAGTDGAAGVAGSVGPAGQTGADGNDGVAGKSGADGEDAASSEAAAMILPTVTYSPGMESVSIVLSGFLRRDTVTAVIVEAFGPGQDYVMGTGQVNPSGALILTVGTAVRPAIPANLATGIWTVRVTGERVPAGTSGPSKASAPLIVFPAGSLPPVDGK